mmetsp:Transcript_113175/g.320331  ORF Transcript_113175/g.320331 Transcript_113175/m.320331 type:complete len:358 (+) Transcript_113175:972-2045(+)
MSLLLCCQRRLGGDLCRVGLLEDPEACLFFCGFGRLGSSSGPVRLGFLLELAKSCLLFLRLGNPGRGLSPMRICLLLELSTSRLLLRDAGNTLCCLRIRPLLERSATSLLFRGLCGPCGSFRRKCLRAFFERLATSLHCQSFFLPGGGFCGACALKGATLCLKILSLRLFARSFGGICGCRCGVGNRLPLKLSTPHLPMRVAPCRELRLRLRRHQLHLAMCRGSLGRVFLHAPLELHATLLELLATCLRLLTLGLQRKPRLSVLFLRTQLGAQLGNHGLKPLHLGRARGGALERVGQGVAATLLLQFGLELLDDLVLRANDSRQLIRIIVQEVALVSLLVSMELFLEALNFCVALGD